MPNAHVNFQTLPELYPEIPQKQQEQAQEALDRYLTVAWAVFRRIKLEEDGLELPGI